MTYILKPYVRCCMYNDQVVFLNLKSDKYIFFNQKDSPLVEQILTKPFSRQRSEKSKDIIKNLEALDLIQKSLTSDPNTLKKTYSSGSPNLDWVIHDVPLKVPPSILEALYAYFVLISVYIRMSLFGFYHLIEKLKRHDLALTESKNTEIIQQKVWALNQASFYFPKRVKCLEWSLALCFILLRKGQKATLQIGLQNFPFASHAWVKVDNEIIADDPNLSRNLAVILSEPFQVADRC